MSHRTAERLQGVRLYLFLIANLLILATGTAGAVAINLPSGGKLTSLTTGAQVFVDPEMSWSPLANTAEPEFTPISEFLERPVEGAWIKLTLQLPGNAASDWQLLIKRRYFERLELYLPDSNGRFNVFRSGTEQLETLPILGQHLVYPLMMRPGSQETVYLYVKTIQRSLDLLEIELQDHRSFSEFKADTELAHGMYFGVMLAMILYNLILLVTLRDRGQALYICAMVSMAAWMAMESGHLLQFLPTFLASRGPMNEIMAASLMFGFTNLFFQNFVDTRSHFKKAHHLFSVLAIAELVIVGLSATLPITSISWLITWSQLVDVLTVVSVLTVAVMMTLQGSRPALIFVIAWSALIGGFLVRALVVGNAIPRLPITEFGVYVGSALEAMLLSIGLAYRIRRLREQRDRAIRQQFEAARLANVDPLTNAYNRRFFQRFSLNAITEANSQSVPVTAMILDLDEFKQINDRGGHGLGDEVLREVKTAIEKELESGQVFARIGGEEFAILLPGTTADLSRYLAERIRKAIESMDVHSTQYDLTKLGLRVSASIGIADTETTGYSVEALLEGADRAMYAAKATGRNRVVLLTEVLSGKIRRDPDPQPT